jgi:hypothetical protein
LRHSRRSCLPFVNVLAASEPRQAARFEPAGLYEKLYCARGDMENRIKEQQI